MAHPKRRHSSTRRDKRRTHDALVAPVLVTCPVTGVLHRPHHGYWHDGKLYYKGELVRSREAAEA